MSRLKLMPFYFCLSILGATAVSTEGNFEDADLANEFITMSFSSSHNYDLRHTIPGEPDIDYPIYGSVPKTNFDCSGRHEGYYADMETRCQVFRICTNTDSVGRGFAFLCPNGTLFSQRDFVCDWYRNVDCNESEQYYNKNDNNRIGTRSQIMETVRQMMEHPMKTISIALNRAKTVTHQPVTHQGFKSTTGFRHSVFRPTSTPVRNFPTHPTISRRPAITMQQVEHAAGQPQTHLGDHANEGAQNFNPPSFIDGVRSTQTTQAPRFPVTSRFATSTPSYSQPPHNSRTSSPSSVFTPDSPVPDTKSQAVKEDGSISEEEVYVSSLGELSTDSEANFDHQTARIIAEPTSSSVHVKITSESGAFNPKKLNFAEKVNAGLNGEQVVDNDEVIAPEYVQNIVNENIPTPAQHIQPPFEFASNVNGLLDEYGSQQDDQNNVQVQLHTPSDAIESTRKPFRFLSRGFSYSSATGIGPYKYTTPTATRGPSSYTKQTFRKSYDFSGSTLRPYTTSQSQASARQQQRTSTDTTARNQDRYSQKNTFQSPGKSPYVPLKQFIVSKFGNKGVPATSAPTRATLPSLAPHNELLTQMQKKSAYTTQYPTTQYNVRQDTAQRQYFQQQRQYAQVHQQQHQAASTAPTQPYRPVQSVKYQPIPSISYTLPAQQQIVQGQRQVHRTTIQQGHQVLQRTIPADAPKSQQIFQRTKRPLAPPPLPVLPPLPQIHAHQQQRPLPPPSLPIPPTQQQVQTPPQERFPPILSSQSIEIYPSQIAMSQSIPGQDAPAASTIPEFASINIRLPTNLAGLIPNGDLYDPRLNNDGTFGEEAQKRYDSFEEETESKREAKSAYSGVSSYDVPLSSVGRLTNDITNLLQRVRRRL